MWIRALVAGAAGLVVALAGLTGCGAGTDPGGVLSVVAAENVWGNIAAQIGGRAVSVTSLITDPNTDPHAFTSDVADTEAVSRAGVVVVNGLGYDTFMGRILGSVGGHRRVVTMAAVLGEHGDANPHLWYDLPRLPVAAAAVEAAMAGADPAHRAGFAAGLARFDRSLRPLDREVAVIRARHAGAAVAYTERVPGYLLAAAGLRVVTPPGFARAVEDGTDPSVADTRAMEALITGHRIRVLLYNEQTVTPVTAQIRALAVAHHVPVVAVAETIPARFGDFQAWQLSQARALLAGLGS